MLRKRTALAATALALIGAGAVGAQLGHPLQLVIDPPPGGFTARWVHIDKSPANGNQVYQRVYCVAYEKGVSCDWKDVRPMYTYTISRSSR